MTTSKFNAEKRAAMLRAFRSGTSQRRLASRYGVDQSTISRQLDLAISERMATLAARSQAPKSS
jgi:transposase-like protein